MKVTYVYADMPQEQNCSNYNCFRPASALNDSGKHQAKIMHINDFASNNPQVQQFCSWADIIVIERNFFGDTLAAIQFWRHRNKPMLAIFDDAYHIITEDNPAYYFWHDNKMRTSPNTISTQIGKILVTSKTQDKFWANIPVPQRDKVIQDISKILEENIPIQEELQQLAVPAMSQFKFGLKLMRGIQTPSRVLSNDWADINDVYYVPNFINPNQYIHAKPLFEKEDDKIIIGWHGSLSHIASFKESGLDKALEIVGKKYSNVKIYLGGDKRNFDNLKLSKNKKIYHDYVSDQEWPMLLKSIDIAVAPLATEYDKRRSWIRGIEYMALQIPWVATDFPVYSDLKEYGMLIDNGVDNWVNALSEVVEHIDDYREKAKGKAYEFALSQSYENNIDKLIDVYEKNINKEYWW